MSEGKAFFDTSVLLYMYGAGSRKQKRAVALFGDYAASGRMLISTQVVKEFYANGSRKLGMTPNVLAEVVARLLNWPLIMIGPEEILSAIEMEQRYEISFWDALIVAAAESGDAEILFTEDLNDGQRYGKVTARNPFQPAH